MSPALDLRLPEPERRRAARLGDPWVDLLYVPGPGLVSAEIDPGGYCSTMFVALAGGELIRVTSLTVPAFGGSLCRLRMEPVQTVRLDALGSFFEPARQGLVFAFAPGRRAGAVRPPADPSWRYDGPSLRPRFEGGTAVRVLREVARTPQGDTWTADRGLVIASAAGEETLLLAMPDESERVVLRPALGVHRALVDAGEPERPGAGRRELLGYGGWDTPLALAVQLVDAGGEP